MPAKKRTRPSVLDRDVWSLSYVEDNSFGPASEPLDIARFVADAERVVEDVQALEIPESEHERIEAICSLEPILGPRDDILAEPRLVHVIRSVVDMRLKNALPASMVDKVKVSTTGKGKGAKGKGKGKKTTPGEGGEGEEAEEEDEEDEEDDDEDEARKEWRESVRHELEHCPLRIARLPPETPSYTRKSRQPDYTALIAPIPSTASSASAPASMPLALLEFTLHARSDKSTALPIQQKIVLHSEQTLADLRDAIKCESDRMPVEDADGWRAVSRVAGACFGIEGVLYSDTREEGVLDYAQAVLSALPVPYRASTTPMHLTTFSSLPLRTDQPYWYLHQGNCEHLFTLSSIRRYDPALDGSSSYPLTTFLPLTTSQRARCRACARLPAERVTLGDPLAGEIPGMWCRECLNFAWGEGADEGRTEDVTVIPLLEGGLAG